MDSQTWSAVHIPGNADIWYNRIHKTKGQGHK
jgi:hypothetical protein